MRFFTLIFVSILLGLLLTLLVLPIAWSENTPTVKLSWDQEAYSPNQVINTSISVTNSSPQPIREFRLKLVLHSPSNKDQILYSRTWYQAFLKPGNTQFKFSRSIPSLGLSEGVYPVSVFLTRNQNTIFQEKSALIVLDPNGKKNLFVAVVLNVHERTHLNPEGFYLNQEVQKNCEPGGFYQQQMALIAKYPKIRINLAFTPILAEQISDISNGYKLFENNQEKSIPPNSSFSKNAQRVLELYQRYLEEGRIEFLSVPYAYPNLDMLAQKGWGEDIYLQIKKGESSLQQNFDFSPDSLGLYPPNLKLSSASLPYVEKTSPNFLLLQDTLLSKNPSYWPYKIKTSDQKEITAFFADSKASKILKSGDDPQSVTHQLLARMAETYLKRPQENKIFVIASPDKNWRPSSQLLDVLYQELGKTSWIKPLTLSDAKKTMPAKKTISLPSKKEGEEANKYSDRLAWAREKFELFSKVTFDNNDIKDDLQKKLLIAEGSDWFGASSNSENLISDFVSSIETTIKKEFSKITLSKSESITLTTRNGKIPIAITNRTGYKVKVPLTLEGDNFLFPEGNTRKVTLKSQENMFTFPVMAKKRGSSKITVTLGENGENITYSTIVVKSTFSSKAIFAAVGSGILLLSLIFGALYFREQYHKKS